MCDDPSVVYYVQPWVFSKSEMDLLQYTVDKIYSKFSYVVLISCFV
jgi:hypothetical protein